MLVIIDSGVSNIASVRKAFAAQTRVEISRDPEVVSRASRLVLPGVGSFDSAMQTLRSKPGLLDAIHESVLDRSRPILGICLGAQLLLDGSDEGSESGLGLIPGRAKALHVSAEVKVPHTGWNSVKSVQESKLITGEEDWRFYFVHSFAPYPIDPKSILGVTDHGGLFPSIIGKRNVFGVQFHPEKSYRFGATLIRNFLQV
jgi:glutamine amidotransferase